MSWPLFWCSLTTANGGPSAVGLHRRATWSRKAPRRVGQRQLARLACPAAPARREVMRVGIRGEVIIASPKNCRGGGCADCAASGYLAPAQAGEPRLDLERDRGDSA